MALFTLGDVHLALGSDKPMDIFEGWMGYAERIEENWKNTLGPEDTMVLLGDISWAMKLEHCREDFAFLERLPGKKWIVKGNHDLWWTTLSKMENYLAKEGFQSIGFLHNNCILAEGLALCGTRGWNEDDGGVHDDKMVAREVMRLKASLLAAHKAAPSAEKVVFLHFPPFVQGLVMPEFQKVLAEFEIRRCFYGHLHANAIRRAVQGIHEGVDYRLVSADALKFCPLQIPIEIQNKL